MVSSVGNGGGLSQTLDNGQVVSVLPTGSPKTSSGGSVNFSWRNRIDGCLFQGRAYVQGQQWLVGCQLSCVCTDATVGKYQCRERCPKYENVPSTCKMVTDPADTCCTYPTDCGPGTNYVPIPVYSQELTNIGAVMSPSVSDLLSGQYTTQLTVALDGITVKAPTTPSSGSTTGYCYYKNNRYQHGEIWEDGCLYNCVCEDGTTGSYRCIEKCERYVNLPAQYCHLEQDPNNPCCERPVCNFLAGHGEIRGNRTSTLAPAPPTPITPRPPTGTEPTSQAPPKPEPPTPPVGSGKTTLAPPTATLPTQRPTPGEVPEMCVYEGRLYSEGQTWFDACDFKCTCVDGGANSYTCLTRCPQYQGDFSTCTQVADPDDPQCCSVPSCTGKAVPPGQFTGIGTIPSRDKCLYKGDLYNGGDVWEDGCRLQCECTDPSIGLIQCTDRCPKVAIVSEGCSLVPDVANPCCQTVQCSPSSQLSPTPSPGSGGSTVEPPKAEVCQYYQAIYFKGQTWNDGCDRRCRCEQNGLYTCTERCPTYENLPPECVLVTDEFDTCCKVAQCTPQIGVTVGTGKVPTLPPRVITGVAQSPDPGQVPRLGACVYKGVMRGLGEQWFDGCELSCTCEDILTGRYKCTERCPSYGDVAPQCKLVKDASEPCCEVPVCDPTYVTPAPGAPTTLAPPLCVYDGQSYTEGQTWYTPGCDYKCICEDADQGIYRCTDRCPVIVDRLPTECKLVADPNDPLCCEVASCSPVPSNTSSGYLVPTLPPGTVTGRQVTPSPLPGQVPQPDVCIYKGKTYTPGQKWTDGCEYDCLCEGQGTYKCIEICPDYSVLPAQCTLVPDPSNPCCKIPFCDVTLSTPPTISPQSTRIPGINRDACVYNGVPYYQGSHWHDGCDFKCICEDSKTNKYRCDQRCSRYDTVPIGCLLQTDPQDACCQALICDPGAIPNPVPIPYPTPYPIPAKFPGKTTGQSVGNNTGFCQYNGVLYRQGDTWDDGCQARCVCLDQDAGIYDCTDRCVEFVQLPMTCQLVEDPNDPCCSVPKCGGEATSTPPSLSPTSGLPPTPSPKPSNPGTTLTPDPNNQPTPSPRPGSSLPTLTPKPITTPTPSPQPGSSSPTLTPKPNAAPTPSPQPECQIFILRLVLIFQHLEIMVIMVAMAGALIIVVVVVVVVIVEVLFFAAAAVTAADDEDDDDNEGDDDDDGDGYHNQRNYVGALIL
ncbi:collagen alpha-4(vi) chain [Plakobranchus ocellatus]|uniref:Collagen alpha-4(Vi) chain n=1 Tax=Plakobranchus ocellatus TaxID=259542 RepID=A0AAV4BVZ3_9GAST|nr:collagen alpha-4(vi) chain [Plakobranchus ocellatus]